MEQALVCFRALYHSFQLRDWVQESDESEYREEYVEFPEHFRISCGQFRTPELVPGVVDLLIPMPALRNRPRLLHLFRLSCLCLTECNSSLPTILFQGANSFDPNSRL